MQRDIVTEQLQAQPVKTNLLRRLVQMQGVRTDREMAAWLGVERSYWARIKAGERPLTLAIIRRAIAQDKGLMADFLIDLMPEEKSA